jgi:hypothetical protein
VGRAAVAGLRFPSAEVGRGLCKKWQCLSLSRRQALGHRLPVCRPGYLLKRRETTENRLVGAPPTYPKNRPFCWLGPTGGPPHIAAEVAGHAAWIHLDHQPDEEVPFRIHTSLGSPALGRRGISQLERHVRSGQFSALCSFPEPICGLVLPRAQYRPKVTGLAEAAPAGLMLPARLWIVSISTFDQNGSASAK